MLNLRLVFVVFVANLPKLVSSQPQKVESGNLIRNVSLSGTSHYIVQLHNDYRREVVTKKASNMRRLSWSDELAREAMVQSSRCMTPYHEPRYGYNYAALGSTDYEVRELVELFMLKWRSEKARPFRPCMDDCNNHTQIMWAETTRLGCDLHFCPVLRGKQRLLQNVYFFVCIYDKRGNIQGQAPARYGAKPCSGCDHFELCDSGLCNDNGCENLHMPSTDCDGWAGLGHCVFDSDWMDSHCKRSCGWCRPVG